MQDSENLLRPIISKKPRYRLLADGGIFDRKLQKEVGFIFSRLDLNEAWQLRGKELQEYLKRFI